MLNGDNMPLGFYEKEVYRQISGQFESGDLFLFYSDGLTESQNDQKECFGEERVVELVRQNRSSSVDGITRKIREAVMQFVPTKVLADDLTCVAVKIMD